MSVRIAKLSRLLSNAFLISTTYLGSGNWMRVNHDLIMFSTATTTDQISSILLVTERGFSRWFIVEFLEGVWGTQSPECIKKKSNGNEHCEFIVDQLVSILK